ncbi:MAG: tetratricopeptide repeat protein [Thermoguttaceae bacterium]
MSKYKNSSKKHAPHPRSAISTLSGFRLQVLAGAAIIAVAALLAYFPSLSGGFIWDDNDLYLTENPIIKVPNGLFRFWCTTEPFDYYPVSNSTLWIEWRLWEVNSTGYHLTNLIFHVAETLLIWIILRRLFIPGAFLAAVIFALHPVNVESVAWISQRKEMLAMLFFLLSILWYLKYLELARRPIFDWYPLAAKPSIFHYPLRTFSSFILHPSSFYFWYWLSLASFAMAMLSKGSVAILPMLLLGVALWLRCLTRQDLLRIMPFFAIALPLTVVNVWFQRHGSGEIIRSADFTQRLLGAGGVVWFYLYKAIFPINLLFIYEQWDIKAGNPLWWLPLLAVLAVTALLCWHRKKSSRPLLFAWGFFCIALLPVLGFTDIYFMKYSLVSDHYQHIAIIGVIALAAACFYTWRNRSQGAARRAKTGVAVMAAGILLFLTWRQSGLYLDETTLFQATLKKNPECWMAYNNLGRLLLNFGRLQEARPLIERSLAINPNNDHAHNNMAIILMETGQPEEAIKHCQEAMRIDPKYSGTYNNLGMALLTLDKLPESIENFELALKLNPNNAMFHNNFANALLKAGRTGNAIDQYKKALQLRPDFTEACCNLAAAYAKMDQSREAIAEAQKALELARNKGQTAIYKKMESWLNSYRSRLPNLPGKPPNSESKPPLP